MNKYDIYGVVAISVIATAGVVVSIVAKNPSAAIWALNTLVWGVMYFTKE